MLIDTEIKLNEAFNSYEKIQLFRFISNSLTGKVSTSDVKRVIQQGGVEVNEKIISDPNAEFTFKSGDVIKFGKRDYIKIS